MNFKNKFPLRQFNFKKNIDKIFFFLLLFIFSAPFSVKADQGKVDSLLNLLKNYPKEDTNKVHILKQLCDECNAHDILKYAGPALKLSEKIGYKKGIADAYSSIGFANDDQGNLEEAVMYNLKSAKIYEEINDNIGLGSVFNNLGSIYKDHGYYIKALDYFQKSLRLKEESGDVKETLIVIRNIGQLFETQGDLEKALEYQEKSLSISREIKNKNEEAVSLNNIAVIYNGYGNYQKALEYQEKCLKIYTVNEDKPNIAQTLSEIGMIYHFKHDFTNARLNLGKSLSLYTETNNKSGIANVLNNIGGTYDQEGDYINALKYFKESLKNYEILNEWSSSTLILINIAVIYNKQSDYHEAQKFAEDGLNMATKTSDRFMLSSAAKLLSRIYASQNKYKRAYETHVLYKQYADSIRNAEIKNTNLKSQMQYEFETKESLLKADQEKKDAATKAQIEKGKTRQKFLIAAAALVLIISVLIIFLFRSNHLNKEKESQLRVEKANLETAEAKKSIAEANLNAFNATQEALRAQMNPHFIFNSLNSIRGFLLKNKTEEADRYLLKFADLMRKVLENSRHQEIALENEIETLVLYMDIEKTRLNKPFHHSIQIDKNVDAENTYVPPLIFQPFVENAIWHGLQHKPDAGKIEIFISQENNKLTCTIEDNGIGREKSGQLKMTAKGKESLGMKLTLERLKLFSKFKKAEAGFNIVDLAAGTRVELSLPLFL